MMAGLGYKGKVTWVFCLAFARPPRTFLGELSKGSQLKAGCLMNLTTFLVVVWRGFLLRVATVYQILQCAFAQAQNAKAEAGNRAGKTN